MRLNLPEKINAFTEILSFFVSLEADNIVIEDFYDGCIIYDFDQKKVSLCDLDHFHVGSYVLEKDRQYGSSRFMAPEESIKGATIDRQTNVYTMGATGFVLLNNNQRDVDEWFHDIKLYNILKKATSQNREDRYPSIKTMYTNWMKAIKKIE